MSDETYGSPTSGMGPRQLEVPRRLEVVRFLGGAGIAGTRTVRVRMQTPDARLIQKLTLVGVASGNDSGASVLAGRGLLLWLYAVELDETRGRRWIPVTDLAGSTNAAPIALPANAALGGFSREFVTTADGIEGQITIPAQAPGGIQGSLFVQARFQPAAFRLMPWEEWDEVRQSCKIETLDDVLIIP